MQKLIFLIKSKLRAEGINANNYSKDKCISILENVCLPTITIKEYLKNEDKIRQSICHQ